MQDSCHQQFHLIFESWLLLGYFGGTWGMISGLVGFRSWKVWKVSFFHFLTKNHSQHFDPDSSSSSSSAAAAAVIILIIFFMYRYHAHIPPLSQHTNMKLQFSYVTNLPESLFQTHHTFHHCSMASSWRISQELHIGAIGHPKWRLPPPKT